ncbi:MAG: hypothetical protein SFY81_10425 [Verrucomicrobiota bacterium]|nr:hypothetical protein [Verrucomicrobiota bacterium]
MKKLRQLFALVAALGTAAFMTGCGDDNDDNNNNNQPAPQVRQFNMTGGTFTTLTLTGGDTGTYTSTPAGAASSGTYTTQAAGNDPRIQTFTLTPTGGGAPTTITITYSPASATAGTFQEQGGPSGNFTQTVGQGPAPDNSGNPTQFAPASLVGRTYTFNVTGGAGSSVVTFDDGSTFRISEVGGGAPRSGTYSATLSSNTWTIVASEGGNNSTIVATFTADGSGTYSTTGAVNESGTFVAGGTQNPPGNTNGGSGTGNAPASLSGTTWILTIPAGAKYPGTFNVVFTPTQATLTDTSTGSSGGNPNYTYNPNGDTATLVFTHTGTDNDNYTLNFSSANAATVTGTQTDANDTQPIPAGGTFNRQ